MHIFTLFRHTHTHSLFGGSTLFYHVLHVYVYIRSLFLFEVLVCSVKWPIKACRSCNLIKFHLHSDRNEIMHNFNKIGSIWNRTFIWVWKTCSFFHSLPFCVFFLKLFSLNWFGSVWCGSFCSNCKLFIQLKCTNALRHWNWFWLPNGKSQQHLLSKREPGWNDTHFVSLVVWKCKLLIGNWMSQIILSSVRSVCITNIHTHTDSSLVHRLHWQVKRIN